jgi:hypothetical protein
MILREIVALFGLDYDNKGQKRAEKGIDSVKKKMTDLTTFARTALGAIGAAGPFFLLAKMGSDAQESLNLLNTIFEGNAQAVMEWAKTTGAAIGQSHRELAGLASQFGALLRPMVGNNEQLVEMTTNLAALAVDLTSLQNLRPGEALQAFRSGLSGSAEAVARYGIDLRTARVEAEALRRGITKSASEMTRAEQATIRYSLIMKDLAFVQGDAMRTQNDFANALRGVQGMLKDVGINLGLFLVPGFEGIFKIMKTGLKIALDLTERFMMWNRETNLAVGILTALGVVITAALMPSLLGLLIPLFPIILAFVALALIADELITTFQGGDSLLNRFGAKLDELEKNSNELHPALAALVWVINRFRDAMKIVGALAEDFITYLMENDPKPFNDRIDGLVASFWEWVEPIKEVVKWLDRISASEFLELIAGKGREFLADLGFTADQPLGPRLGQGPVSAGPQPGPTATQGVVIRNEPKVDINVTQQPGESGEDLARRVKTEIDKDNEERSQAILKALVPEPG